MSSDNLKNTLAHLGFWGSIASGLLLVFFTVSFAQLHAILARVLVLSGAALVLLPLLAVRIAFIFRQRKEAKQHALARPPGRRSDFWAPPVLLAAGDGLSTPHAFRR